MSTLRVSNIEAKADASSPSVDEKLKVTNSNGDVLVHIDGKTAGITTFGINSTGNTFSVDNANNVVFSGIVTATKFSLSGGGEITGGDGNFTGIVTAASIDATSATFGGNVSIGGTLTYEDVTNIDSVGIITARSNVNAQSDVIVGAGLSVVGISTLANTNVNGQLTATNARITGVTTFGTSSTTINGAHEYPSIRPTLDLNFAATKTLDRRITFTRDSLGTFTDEMGIVRYASNNVPRFDHDPTTGESLGLLIEESRTNVAESSEDFGNTSFWSPTNQTITTNVATAPDGNLTADNIVPASGSADTRYLYFSASAYSMSASASYATSIFVKKNGLRYFALQAADNGSGSGLRAGFDLDNGTVVTSNVFGSASGVSASIVEFPNGWFRCILTGTSASGSSTGRTAFSFSSALDSNASVGAITADGSSGGYVWGHQVEAGAFPTSYIPTSGSTVIRGQDFAKITGTNFTDFYNQSEGTLVLSADIGYLATSNQAAVAFEDTSNVSATFIAMGYNTGGGGSGTAGAWYNSSGTTSAFASHNTGITINTEFKQAYAYKLNDFSSVANGSTPITDTSGGLTSLIDRVRFGIYHYDGMTSGHIRQFKYYNKRLPNAQLQGLTQQ